MITPKAVTRRHFIRSSVASTAGLLLADRLAAATTGGFKLNYLVASSVFGSLPLKEILPEVRRAGSEYIDLWPRRHGTQREEAEQLGSIALAELLAAHGVKIACTSRYDLGPLNLMDEFRFLQGVNARLVVTAARGPTGLKGEELKSAIRELVRSMEPTLEAAGQAGITVAIENHSNSLIDSPDSVRWLAEFAQNRPLGIAFAPYHLPQEPTLLAELIRHSADRLSLFYAWQHGNGSSKPMPREQEHLQMPGRGPLDFIPLLAALRDIRFAGWTEVFMHPTPRGIPIMDTAPEVTTELNRGRAYLDAGIASLPS
jgi:sugar phosphate isomerase/epimerase